jgi:hypothetical protein
MITDIMVFLVHPVLAEEAVTKDGPVVTNVDRGLVYQQRVHLASIMISTDSQNWYEPQSRESPNPQFDAFRRGAPSPPALSPPSSTTSAPTTGSSNPYGYHAYPEHSGYAPMAVTPSPPPQHPYGMTPTGQSGVYSPNGMSQYGAQSMANMAPQSRWRTGYQPMQPDDDDVIPTAIVIKNIPFAVSRDHLLGVIESLGAPVPYAFNYHHDNGVFRGLAFANFRAPEEAASVVAALNGYDVQGRKLRVEYKKVLQPGEKDKIEREKALKRMKSVQFDREMMPPPPITVPPIHTNGNMGMGIHDHSPPPSASSASGSSEALPMVLDLNDPMALDIYSRLLVFKEDRMRDELAFSRNLSPVERRIVHLVAQKLGLSSQTKLEGDYKTVVVTRDHNRPQLTATTSSTSSSHYLSPYPPTPTGEVSPSLRIKKSMPDLRGFNGPVVARDPSRSLTPQRSSGNLREQRDYSSMGAAHGRKNFGSGNFGHFFGSDAPPVPPIPTGMNLHRQSVPSLNGSASASASASSPTDDNLAQPQPLRNPRGPSGESRGFGLRTSQSTILRGSNGAGVIGRRVEEESEDSQGESTRTRESLDI